MLPVLSSTSSYRILSMCGAQINKLGQMQHRLLFISLTRAPERELDRAGDGDGRFGARPSGNAGPNGESQTAHQVRLDPIGGANIDPEGASADAMLYNFDKHHRLKKKLPLRQMIQLEKSVRDNKRLSIVFSSQGM